MQFPFSSLRFESEHSEPALHSYKVSVLLKGQVWCGTQTSCEIGSIANINCFGKTGHKQSRTGVQRSLLCIVFFPSVLVLEPGSSRHITAVGICQDTPGEGVVMEHLSFPSRSSHVGRYHPEGCLPLLSTPVAKRSVTCQPGTFHKHKIHLRSWVEEGPH